MAVVTYKCPNCGGGLIFDPQAQDFGCEYCGSHFTEEELDRLAPAREQEDRQPAPEPEAAGAPGPGEASAQEHYAVVYRCPSCGAEVVTDETTAATFCYYCHNPVVLEGRLQGEYAPDKVIPFAVERERAVSDFLEWAGKKWFVPRAFFSKQQIEKISGVYFPYWTADFDIHGVLEGTGTQVRTWRAGNTEYTETRHYRVAREGRLVFEEIVRNALQKANRKLVEGILPFNGSAAKDFQMGYLSGFQAEKRDVDKEQVEQEVAGEAREYSETLLRESAPGYAAVVPSRLDADVVKADWHYILLPVWVLTYKGRGGKIYYYAMNGQTGKVCGELPVDGKRLAALFAAVALPLFAILSLGGWLL